MTGLPVHHQLLELAQTHVHQVGDAIQPSHPLSSPSPPAFNLSQHQGLFQWVSCLHQVAKILEFQLQHQSFQWTPRADLLQNGLVGSPCSPRDSQESSPTPQFKSINSLALLFLYSPNISTEYFCYIDLFSIPCLEYVFFFLMTVHSLFSELSLPYSLLDHPGASIFYVYILL